MRPDSSSLNWLPPLACCGIIASVSGGVLDSASDAAAGTACTFWTTVGVAPDSAREAAAGLLTAFWTTTGVVPDSVRDAAMGAACVLASPKLVPALGSELMMSINRRRAASVCRMTTWLEASTATKQLRARQYAAPPTRRARDCSWLGRTFVIRPRHERAGDTRLVEDKIGRPLHYRVGGCLFGRAKTSCRKSRPRAGQGIRHFGRAKISCRKSRPRTMFGVLVVSRLSHRVRLRASTWPRVPSLDLQHPRRSSIPVK